MGEVGEIWRALREKAKKHKQSNRDEFRAHLSLFRKAFPNIRVDELTPYQFRFYLAEGEVRLDVYPSNKKWHNINTQKRGIYSNLFDLLEAQGSETTGPPESKLIKGKSDWKGDQSIGKDEPPW